MFTSYRKFLFLTLMVSFFFVPLGLKSTIPTLPQGVIVSFSPGRASVTLSLRCYSAQKFTAGSIYILVSSDSGATPDSIVLWTGKSDSELFVRSFSHTFPSHDGKKSAVKAVFQCLVTGETTAYFDKNHVLNGRKFASFQSVVEEQWFLLNRLDTVLVDMSSYGDLEYEEVYYELKKGGYENLPDNQLRLLNHELWRRFHKVHGQIRND